MKKLAIALSLFVTTSAFAGPRNDNGGGSLRIEGSGGNALVVEATELAENASLRDLGLREDVIRKYHETIKRVPVYVVRKELFEIHPARFHDYSDLPKVLQESAITEGRGNGEFRIYVSDAMENELKDLLNQKQFQEFLRKAKIDPTLLSAKDMVAALMTREYFFTLGYKDGEAIFLGVLQTRASHKSAAGAQGGTITVDHAL